MEEVFRVSGYIGKRERKRRQETDTRHLIGVQALTEYGLVTYGQETLVYFLIKPANLPCCQEAMHRETDICIDDGAERGSGS